MLPHRHTTLTPELFGLTIPGRSLTAREPRTRDAVTQSSRSSGQLEAARPPSTFPALHRSIPPFLRSRSSPTREIARSARMYARFR